MASSAEKRNKAKKAKAKQRKEHVKKTIIPKLIAFLETRPFKQKGDTQLDEEVTLFERGKSDHPTGPNWFVKKANEVTNTSFTGETLFIEPRYAANIRAYSQLWNPQTINTYGDWVRKDWRLVFSYEVLSHLGFDLETINKAKKDYHFVMDQILSKNPEVMAPHEFDAEKIDHEPHSSQPDAKTGKPIGFPALSCWHTCQRFVYLAPHLEWKLVEGHLQSFSGDAMTGNIANGDVYYHAWLELDGVIIDPVARNIVRGFDSTKQSRNDDGSLKTLTLNSPIEAVAPTFRPETYRPIVKRKLTQGYKDHILSCLAQGHFDRDKDSPRPSLLRWGSYTWRQIGHKALAENPKVDLNQIDFKLDPSDEIVEDPAFHFSFFSQVNSVDDHKLDHSERFNEGDLLFDFIHHASSAWKKLFRKDVLNNLLIETLQANLFRFQPELAKDCVEHWDEIKELAEGNTSHIPRDIAGLFKDSDYPWFHPNAVVKAKTGKSRFI